MNAPRPAVRSRGRLIVSVLVVGVAFAAGMTVVGARRAANVTAAIAGLGAITTGAWQFVGEVWPRRQRWLSYVSVIGFAGAMGVLARMVVQLISKML